MTSRSLLLSAVVAGLVLSIFPCSAQEGAKVTLRFVSFPKSIDPEPVELVTGEGKTIEVALPSNELSTPYRVPQLGTWALGETVQGDDGKPSFNVFGKTTALSSPSQLILVIRKGKDYADGFDVVAIDNRVARFGGGKLLFMNAAKVDIAGVVGGEKFAVKPGRHIILHPTPDKDNNTFHTTLYFRKGEEARPFFSSRWPLSDRARGLIFFYHDPNTQRLRLHSIRDFLEG